MITISILYIIVCDTDQGNNVPSSKSQNISTRYNSGANGFHCFLSIVNDIECMQRNVSRSILFSFILTL